MMITAESTRRGGWSATGRLLNAIVVFAVLLAALVAGASGNYAKAAWLMATATFLEVTELASDLRRSAKAATIVIRTGPQK